MEPLRRATAGTTTAGGGRGSASAPSGTPARHPLFEAGRDVKQVPAWLGHTDPAFTLRTYVHVMDAGVGDADFFDADVRVNTGSAQRPEIAATDRATATSDTAA